MSQQVQTPKVQLPKWVVELAGLIVVVAVVGIVLLGFQVNRLNEELAASRAESQKWRQMAESLQTTAQKLDPAVEAMGRAGGLANDFLKGIEKAVGK